MKVLWVGDAVVSSGFARCTHAACDALAEAGHEVTVLGMHYHGDPRYRFPYDIYPCRDPLDQGQDPFGVTRLPVLVSRLEPDVVVILNDPWNIRAYLLSMKRLATEAPPIVAWLAVDAKNQHGQQLNDLALVVTWTEFAMSELRAGGYEGPGAIVPLGVDTDLFRPRDRANARASMWPEEGLPLDAFVVGVVGRNQPRKRLDLTLEYFAEWIGRHGIEDAWLCLQVAPTGDVGVDLHSLIRYHGLNGRIALLETGVGSGLHDEAMPTLYSCFDVYLSTSQGEGWGLPCLEAMACGVPCVVPDFAALGEWTENAALKVPCTSTAPSAPLNDHVYTLGGIPDREGTVVALQSMYEHAEVRRVYADRGRRLAERYQWRETGEGMRRVLERVLGVLDGSIGMSTHRALERDLGPPGPDTGDMGATV